MWPVAGYEKACEEAMEASGVWGTPDSTEGWRAVGRDDVVVMEAAGSARALGRAGPWEWPGSPSPKAAFLCLSLVSSRLLAPGGEPRQICGGAASTVAPPIYYRQVIIAVSPKCGLPH